LSREYPGEWTQQRECKAFADAELAAVTIEEARSEDEG
jgi:hypothetical protein